MEIDIEKVKEFLATDEGKTLVEAHEVVQGIRSKRDELLGEKDKWRAKYEPYADLGTPEELRAALEKMKTTGKEKDDNVDNDLLENLRSQLAQRDEKLTRVEQNYVNSIVEAQIEATIAAAKGNPKLLKKVVSERVKATLNDDGKVVIEVFNRDGKKIYKNDESPGSIADIVEDLKSDEDYGIAFSGSGASGSGTRGSTTQRTGGVITDRSDPNFDYSAYMKWASKNKK